MSPEPQMRSMQGWTRANESSFLSKVQSSNGFQKVMGSYSKSSGVSLSNDDLQSFAEDLCKCCLHEADDVMASEGPLAAAMQEAQALKQKLTQCNLSTMKQMAAMRTAGHWKSELRDDTIVFHEPLQYLDEECKELVLIIVADKVRQLENGTAPPSLIEALTRQAQALAGREEGASLEELRETQAELEKARSEARALRARTEDAEEEAERLRGELVEVKTTLAATQHAFDELKAQHAELQAAHQELQELSVRQQAEIERQQAEIEQQREEIARLGHELEEERRANAALRAEVERLEELTAKQQAQIERQQAEIERQQAEIERLSKELQEERQANAKLRAEVQQLQESLQKLQKELSELQARFEVLKKEADEMRAELARRNNTRTQGTQTSLTGSKLDEQTAETKRLKVMLEEMQMKLKELIEKYRKKFGAEAKEIAKELGIDQLLKEDTVFQRLYDDALERVDRLERLRSRIRKERKDLGASPDPSTEGSVLAAMEQSDLKGVRRFLGDAFSSAAPSPDPTPAKLRSSRTTSCGTEAPPVEQFLEPTPMKARMQPSVSLPSLHANAQNVAVLNLNLGARQRSLRRM